MTSVLTWLVTCDEILTLKITVKAQHVGKRLVYKSKKAHFN